MHRRGRGGSRGRSQTGYCWIRFVVDPCLCILLTPSTASLPATCHVLCLGPQNRSLLSLYFFFAREIQNILDHRHKALQALGLWLGELLRYLCLQQYTLSACTEYSTNVWYVTKRRMPPEARATDLASAPNDTLRTPESMLTHD